MGRRLTRRLFLTSAGVAGAAGVLAACGATPTPQVIKEVVTQVVEKEVTTEVEKVVKETVLVESTVVVKETVLIEQPTVAATTEKVNILYWQYMTDMEEIETPILEAFNRTFPNYAEVKWEYIPWDEYWTKLNATLSAGNPPDVWNTAPTFYFEYILRNQLADITDLFSASINPDDFFNAALSGYDLEQKYYGIPRNVVSTVVFFNQDLFDQAGVEAPPLDGNWTWDDYLAKAQAVTDFHNKGSDKITTFGASTMQGVGWTNVYMKANGASPFKGDFRRDLEGMELDYTQAPCSDTVGFFSDLINTYKVAPPAGEFEGQGDPLLTGRLAMTFTLNWGVNTYKDAPFAWNLTQCPKGSAANLTYGGADGLVLSQASQVKNQSWSLIMYLIDPKTGGDFLTSSGAMPVLKDKSVLEAYLGRHPDKNLQAFIDSSDFADNTYCLGYSELNQACDDEFANVYLGNTPIAEGAQKATTAGNDAMQRIYQQYKEATGG
jgi:multiple sugar transport system substrate-binding protein